MLQPMARFRQQCQLAFRTVNQAQFRHLASNAQVGEAPDASALESRPSGPPKSKFLNIGNFVREFLVINPKCDKFPKNHFSVTKIRPLKTFQAVFFYGGQISLRT
jgi:hypothetical protein